MPNGNGERKINLPIVLGIAGVGAIALLGFGGQRQAPSPTPDQPPGQVPSNGNGNGSQNGNGNGVPEPTIPINIIVHSGLSIEAANQTQFNTLIRDNLNDFFTRNHRDLIEQGKIVFNANGQRIAENPPLQRTLTTNLIESLAQFIRSGGIWIDYTVWPMRVTNPLGRFIPAERNNFNQFINELGVDNLRETLGLTGFGIFQRDNADFIPPDNSSFRGQDCLNLEAGLPSEQFFITSSTLRKPYASTYDEEFTSTFCMFAVRLNEGLYFWANKNIVGADDYADFVETVVRNTL